MCAVLFNNINWVNAIHHQDIENTRHVSVVLSRSVSDGQDFNNDEGHPTEDEHKRLQ